MVTKLEYNKKKKKTKVVCTPCAANKNWSTSLFFFQMMKIKKIHALNTILILHYVSFLKIFLFTQLLANTKQEEIQIILNESLLNLQVACNGI